MERKKLGIYVHIPFCVSKCNYCSFISFCQKTTQDKKDYVQSLLVEMKSYANTKADYLVDTIYIGGGTPSTLFYGAVETIIKNIKQCFNVDKSAEITIECNPNSLTIQALQEYKRAGVNRISLGLQCYNNKILKTLNRPHTKQDFAQAMKKIKLVGFENVSVDLMINLPHQKHHHIKKSIANILKYDVPHISCYGLILEEGTKLFSLVENKQLTLPSEDKAIKQYDYVVKKLEKKGINRYEVSNFCKEGFESKHNYKYWNGDEYIGLGVGAHSYFKGERYKNFENLQDYQEYYKSTESNNTTVIPQTKKFDCTKCSSKDLQEEMIMLSLRTKNGLNTKKYKELFGVDLLQDKTKELKDLFKNNLVVQKGDNLVLTNEGFHLLNQIILMLI